MACLEGGWGTNAINVAQRSMGENGTVVSITALGNNEITWS